MTRNCCRYFVTLAMLVCIASPFAWGFGQQGHSIVGRIAELRLSEKAHAALADLTDRSLADIQLSSWPDTITHTSVFPLNAFWHYADIPYKADEFDAKREAVEVAQRAHKTVDEIGTENNVIDKITFWKNVLANPKESRYRRYTALRFVVHFVGDIHQPLHCINNDDIGGNLVLVRFLGQFDPETKLHQVWDRSLVVMARGALPLEAYAGKLNARITEQNQKNWEASMDPKTWAKESHALAKKHVYPPVLLQQWEQHKHEPVDLDIAYAKQGVPVVETQMMKSGVRLAKILNDALAP